MISDLLFLSPLHPPLGATERRNLGTDVLAPISFLPWWDDAAQCQAFDLIRGMIEILVPFSSRRTSGTGSRLGTTTPVPTSGSRPPTRSSPPWLATANEFRRPRHSRRMHGECLLPNFWFRTLGAWRRHAWSFLARPVSPEARRDRARRPRGWPVGPVRRRAKQPALV